MYHPDIAARAPDRFRFTQVKALRFKQDWSKAVVTGHASFQKQTIRPRVDSKALTLAVERPTPKATKLDIE